MIRCELLLNGYVYEVTNDLVNWDDVEMKWKRQDFDGVVRSFTTKFEFSGSAYSLLITEWLKNSLESSATIVFYTRNNSWLWNEKFRCALDFSTFSYNSRTCEINAIDNSLSSLIKAKKGTEYEYSVDRLESHVLEYDHLIMDSDVQFMVPAPGEDYDPYAITKDNNLYKIKSPYNSFPLYVSVSNVSIKNQVEILDEDTGVGLSELTYDNIPYFFRNISYVALLMNLECQMSIDLFVNDAFTVFKFLLIGITENEGVSILYDKYLTRNEIDGIKYGAGASKVGFSLSDISIPKGCKLSFIIETIPYDGSSRTAYFAVTDISFSITFKQRGVTDLIDIVTPSVLLNRLLKSMNGGNDGLSGVISGENERLNKTMLVAAESIRGLKNAKLRTSYNKFVNWMAAEFGFVPVVGDSIVTFVPRASLFKDTEISKLDSFTDFEYSVDSSMIYSRVRVGYDKVDYEGVNGRDEFRFTTEYTTGTKLTDNTLELISPYRADAYGIEFLANKRGEETTDNKSDNDVFMVGVVLKDGVYVLDRSYPVTNVVSPDSMFNVMYSQLEMIKDNESYIGSFCNRLDYSSSDGNSDVVIGGVPLKEDIDISKSLFSPARMSVQTDEADIPSDLSGYVSFVNQGRRYKGFVDEITLNIGRFESIGYDLIVKEVE